MFDGKPPDLKKGELAKRWVFSIGTTLCDDRIITVPTHSSSSTLSDLLNMTNIRQPPWSCWEEIYLVAQFYKLESWILSSDAFLHVFTCPYLWHHQVFSQREYTLVAQWSCKLLLEEDCWWCCTWQKSGRFLGHLFILVLIVSPVCIIQVCKTWGCYRRSCYCHWGKDSDTAVESGSCHTARVTWVEWIKVINFSNFCLLSDSGWREGWHWEV